MGLGEGLRGGDGWNFGDAGLVFGDAGLFLGELGFGLVLGLEFELEVELGSCGAGFEGGGYFFWFNF